MARPPIDVTILGTSSAAPTVRRGLSGTALVREGETILFDCGEGTQFRMLEAEIPRRKFRHIFITHLHGDHIFGLPGLISSLNLSQHEETLHLFGPRGIGRYMQFVIGFPRPTRLSYVLEIHELAPDHEGLVWETRDWSVSSMPLDHTIRTARTPSVSRSARSGVACSGGRRSRFRMDGSCSPKTWWARPDPGGRSSTAPTPPSR
jgi:ribonuclease Z